MNYYLAPLEGITTYIYRNAYHSVFHPMEKYFTPFIVPRMKKGMNSREINDILPEHNQGLFVVPQLLTNQAEDFIKVAETLAAYGYQEINLNLGCPSGTVVAKGKGAGFLAHPRELERFLEKIFSVLTMDISIKTRIGMEDPEEFEPLLEIFNQYPLKELIIHPRVREDYYRRSPNFSVFEKAMKKSAHPLCYNGNVFTKGDYQNLLEKFPALPAVMLGRGIIANPSLRQSLEGEEPKKKKEQFQRFHTELYQGYQKILSGDRNVLFKMKELWSYLAQSFTDYEPYAKKIRKTGTLSDYETIVKALFREQEVVSNGRFSF
ncbi:MAG: tRNA-dihydrouridine synthase family protein [Lachnospiraceae bacterium]|nr:tRNA-dihydrouridine synthase family protein [Lachnospiraceae bacterium]